MTRRRRRWPWVLGVTLGVLLLEFLPGAYTIDSFQDEWEPGSPEGIALQALKTLSLETDMWFDRSTRQRISRNAELLVPTGTRITLTASMIPLMENNEAVARPRTWELRASRPLTFVYRGVTVARARRMRIRSDDPERRVRAIGTYRILSALTTAHRYKRQKKVRRAYQAPDHARLSIRARFQPDHFLEILPDAGWSTGTEPAAFDVKELTWNGERFVSGHLDLAASFTNPEAFLEGLRNRYLDTPMNIGGGFTLRMRQLDAITFETNLVRLHAKGTLAPNSGMAKIMSPSFNAHLGFGLEVPENQRLGNATAGVFLKNVYALDVNRSHTWFDTTLRGLVRKNRHKIAERIDLRDELPDTEAIPRHLYFDRFRVTPNPEGGPRLEIRAVIPDQWGVPAS